MLPYVSGILQTLSETPLWQMITSGTWMAIVTPVHSRRSFVVEPQTSILIPFAYMILVMSEIWSSIFQIPSSISLPICALLIPVIFHHHDLVMCCATSDLISLSGPRVSIRHADEQILILIQSPLHTPLEYLNYAFQTPILLVATNAVKATTDNTDYAWSQIGRASCRERVSSPV